MRSLRSDIAQLRGENDALRKELDRLRGEVRERERERECV